MESDNEENKEDNNYMNDNKEEKEKNMNSENEIKELEYLFNIAKNSKNKEEALEKYKEIINIEKTKEIKPKNYSFKSYSELCLNSIDERNINNFIKYFSEIQKLLHDDNHNIEQMLIINLMSNILKKLDNFQIKEINKKEILLNKIIHMVKREQTSDFYNILETYIEDHKHEHTIKLEEDNERYPLISLHLTFPKINSLNFKKVIKEEIGIQKKNFKKINNFILTPLSNGKFIYYYDDDDEKNIIITEKKNFIDEIKIKNKHKCFDIKELDNDDIILCLEKKSKIIRIDYNNNKYEIIFIFSLLKFNSFNYFVELTKNLICFGNEDEGYCLWNKIDNNNYEFIHGVNFEDEKKKVFPVDNKCYLTYSLFEENYDNKIEIKFYDIKSFLFFGKTQFNFNTFSYMNSDKFFQLNYIQKYFLLVSYYKSIWILNLKTLKIIYRIQLDTIKEIRILKDSSFLVFFDSENKYENYFFDGKKLIKKWEGYSNAEIIEVLDNFDFVFVYNNYYKSKVKISHMELINKIDNFDDNYY